MKKDYKRLLEELDDDDSGPTVAEVMRDQRMQTLLEKVLESMAKPAPVPQVTVKPEVASPQVVVQAPKTKAVAWTFEFERNDDGTIKRIHATPKG